MIAIALLVIALLGGYYVLGGEKRNLHERPMGRPRGQTVYQRNY